MLELLHIFWERHGPILNPILYVSCIIQLPYVLQLFRNRSCLHYEPVDTERERCRSLLYQVERGEGHWNRGRILNSTESKCNLQ